MSWYNDDILTKAFLFGFSEDDKHIGNDLSYRQFTPLPSAIERNSETWAPFVLEEHFPQNPVTHNVKMQCRGQREAANPLRHGFVCLQLLYSCLKMNVVITDNLLILNCYMLHLHASQRLKLKRKYFCLIFSVMFHLALFPCQQSPHSTSQHPNWALRNRQALHCAAEEGENEP